MKKIIFCVLLLIVLIGQQSCNKKLDELNLSYQPLSPANIDIDAGQWKPLLAVADSFPVPAPVATATSVYAAELNEIKSWQRNITDQQRQIIKYWSAGSVLRWNEILRELVAKHNIPPYQKDDGTYPFPSATNPFAYPVFPFSNPPYAARAYAYVSAAQYDALVATWHYKKLYNRSAPYKIDSSINALIPKSDLPSYPSEDGAVIGATVELMKLLFPADLSYIEQKADENRLYRIIGGANVRSEMEAGEALGKAVAQKFTARARTDRAGAAIGTSVLWAQLETQTAATGETPWISQESPKRPPMLPLFGKVKTFLFDSAALISIRPPAPPSTKSAQFKTELDEVMHYSKNPTTERMKIVQFWADGINTYTPPGHWNTIAADEFVKNNFSEVRWARNFALLNMAMMDAAIACWDTKYLYFNPRPSQVNPNIKTLTGLPNFPSYTSGHSTFSGAASTILGYIIPSKATMFNNMANEASISRLYGAIHYRSDIEQGLLCGQRVGAFAVARAKTDGAD
ncbi:MAG TPA: phosphatase PAP2 family protein [Chitinophagaceae bacterium]|nr:phosphatase PAP2 family protein [Chitinophagaceae bacterium]